MKRNFLTIACAFAGTLCILPAMAFAADPEVTLRVVTPEQYQAEIKKHRGKVVVVDFWATWCVPCIKGFTHTVEWDQKYRDKGLVVISVSMDDADSKDAALEFLKKQKAVFTNLMSSEGGEEEAMKAFGISGGAIPHYKIYDRQGKESKTFGVDPEKPLDSKDIEAAVRAALAAR